MTTSFSQVSFPLSFLMQQIEIGQLALPDIQRPFVWPNTKVRDLFDSMYRGYPVGYLLLWANALAGASRVIGTGPKQSTASLLIVDGQQRLTSLYAVYKGVDVVRGDYRKEKIVIAFNPVKETFAVPDASSRLDPEVLADISVLWSPESSLFTVVETYVDRLSASRVLSSGERRHVQDALNRLHSLSNYSFSALQLTSTTSEEEVAEVFVRINSKGTRLNQADFILTLMSVHWDEGRSDLEDFSRQAKLPSTSGPSPFNHFFKPSPDQLLRAEIALAFRRARLEHVYSILRGKDLETGQFSVEKRDQQFMVLQEAQQYALDLQHFHEFLKALMLAGYRSADMITSDGAILYSYALYLIGRRDYDVPVKQLREVIAQWFFMAAMKARYSGSSESIVEQDLARLQRVNGSEGFVGTLRKMIADELSEDYWKITLPNALEVSNVRSPVVFAYQAALVLLEAKVLFSKLPVSSLLDPSLKAKKTALERHHLFPKAYLHKIGFTEQQDTNQAANYALVEWSDNIFISDKAPATYQPLMLKELGWSAEDLSSYYKWHALPQGWEQMEYRAFLIKRRHLMAAVIRQGFERLKSGSLPEPSPVTISVDSDRELGSSETDGARKELRRSFWTSFVTMASEYTELLAGRTPVQSSSIRVPSGTSGVSYSCEIRDRFASVYLSADTADQQQNIRIVEYLRAKEAEIEEHFGDDLAWSVQEKFRTQYVSYRASEYGLNYVDRWQTTQKELLDALVLFYGALQPHVAEAVSASLTAAPSDEPPRSVL